VQLGGNAVLQQIAREQIFQQVAQDPAFQQAIQPATAAESPAAESLGAVLSNAIQRSSKPAPSPSSAKKHPKNN
jgi:hypothetical protein